MQGSNNPAGASPIQRLHAYWHGLAGGAVPDRGQIDPGAIKPLLPLVCLVEFEADPFRVRYRLSGSRVDEMNGYNLVGHYLDDLIRQFPGDGGDHLLVHYRQCWETGTPTFSSYLWPTNSGGHLEVRYAMFPLKVNDVIRHCIAIEEWDPSDIPVREAVVPLGRGGKNT